MLEVKGLSAFYGDAQALRGVDLRIEDREIVSVVGPNGAGKTTLVNALAGLLADREGEIVLDHVDLARVPGHRVCEHGVAIVPEGRRIFAGMSVRDNLAIGAYPRSARASQAARLSMVYELFPRLQDRAEQRAGTLSGGEQQMLAIGRALMSGPRLLLLDEPSLGLAPVVDRHAVRRAPGHQRGGRLDAARRAERDASPGDLAARLPLERRRPSCNRGPGRRCSSIPRFSASAWASEGRTAPTVCGGLTGRPEAPEAYTSSENC